MRVVARTARLSEPLVPGAGMIEHHIQNDTQTFVMERGDQPVHIIHRPIFRLHRLKIYNTISHVPAGGKKDGIDPDSIDTQRNDIVETCKDAR